MPRQWLAHQSACAVFQKHRSAVRAQPSLLIFHVTLHIQWCQNEQCRVLYPIFCIVRLRILRHGCSLRHAGESCSGWLGICIQDCVIQGAEQRSRLRHLMQQAPDSLYQSAGTFRYIFQPCISLFYGMIISLLPLHAFCHFERM